MATTEKTSHANDGSGGLMGFLKASFETGMSAAEELQQAAISVPLSMLEGLGVPEEKTQVLKDKNRQLVHGMVGSIQSFAGQLAEVGTKQVELAADAIREAAKDKEEKS